MHFNSDIEHIEPAFRLLLTSDGTLTDMLQVTCRERINARILAQEVKPAGRRIDPLDLGPGELVMSRRVLLQGDRTGTYYIYADSCIAITRLDVRLHRFERAGPAWPASRRAAARRPLLVRQGATGAPPSGVRSRRIRSAGPHRTPFPRRPADEVSEACSDRWLTATCGRVRIQFQSLHQALLLETGS